MCIHFVFIILFEFVLLSFNKFQSEIIKLHYAVKCCLMSNKNPLVLQ